MTLPSTRCYADASQGFRSEVQTMNQDPGPMNIILRMALLPQATAYCDRHALFAGIISRVSRRDLGRQRHLSSLFRYQLCSSTLPRTPCRSVPRRSLPPHTLLFCLFADFSSADTHWSSSDSRLLRSRLILFWSTVFLKATGFQEVQSSVCTDLSSNGIIPRPFFTTCPLCVCCVECCHDSYMPSTFQSGAPSPSSQTPLSSRYSSKWVNVRRRSCHPATCAAR